MNELIIQQIQDLKKAANAVILAHNYQIPEVQDIADYAGDSLGLSRKAASVDSDVIVFCGVYFMAETASILCPDKTVLIPEPEAGCPMVDMAPIERFREFREKYPDAVVVTYVNSSAAVKAESDYCCTSANAVDVVSSIDPDKQILFVPDRYLGTYVASCTGRDLTLYDGFCPTHARISADDIHEKKKQFPHALVMVHPECPPQITSLADEVLSTSGMQRVARETDASDIIVCTEVGMVYRLATDNPEKRFHVVSDDAVCNNMKMTNLETVLASLRDMQFVVDVPEDIRQRARRAVDRMVAIGK